MEVLMTKKKKDIVDEFRSIFFFSSDPPRLHGNESSQILSSESQRVANEPPMMPNSKLHCDKKSLSLEGSTPQLLLQEMNIPKFFIDFDKSVDNNSETMEGCVNGTNSFLDKGSLSYSDAENDLNTKDKLSVHTSGNNETLKRSLSFNDLSTITKKSVFSSLLNSPIIKKRNKKYSISSLLCQNTLQNAIIYNDKEGAKSDEIDVRDFNPEKRHSLYELAQMLSSKRVKHGSKGQIYDSMLSIILVGGKNLKPMNPTGLCDSYVRFKLGADKYKSKVNKQSLSPTWNEQFDMKLLWNNNPPPLEISVWDKDPGKDAFIGRAKIELSDLTPETSNLVELGLEDQPGSIKMYLTITGLSAPACISDLNSHIDSPERYEAKESEYSLLRTAENFKQIGWMEVKLHRAIGLAVADLGGASDPFAVIELNNQRLVTPTIFKTLNPQWDKIYEFMIYDIHDVLAISVYDEDKHGAPEFLGRVKIPLLSISSGEKCAYQLKDKRLQSCSKGHIIITTTLHYNSIRASIRSFTPREVNILAEVPRFRRQLLQENVNRLSNLIQSIIATGEFIQSLFTWKYRMRSAFAFMIYILLVLNFDWFMLPMILFLVLLKNYIVIMLSPNKQNDEEATSVEDDYDDDDDNDDKSKKEKSKSFREKWEAINNICTLVQNHMDKIASLGERIKNTFIWQVPFLSYLLMVILLLATVVLYLIPLRYLLLAWGINKFTKRIRKPNAVPNNELLDFLSRVPSDSEVRQYRQLRTEVSLR